RVDAHPLVGSSSAIGAVHYEDDDGESHIDIVLSRDDDVVVRVTWDPGWRAFVDGSEAVIEPFEGVFQSIRVPAGRHRLELVYDPVGVRLACAGSLGALCTLGVLILASGSGSSRSWGRSISCNGLGCLRGIGLESFLGSSPGIPNRKKN